MAQDRIHTGIILMLLFCLLAPLLDVSSKLATEAGSTVGMVTFARLLVQGLLMLPVLYVMRRLSLRASYLPANLSARRTDPGPVWHLSRRAIALLILRALFLILSTFSFVSAIKVMPIADALAIAFVEPFILLILGALLFGDRVGPRRIIACLIGFGGALMVVQPSLAVFGLVALWPLGTAVFFALYMLVTRSIAGFVHPVAMQFHTGWLGVALMLPLLVMSALMPVAAGTGSATLGDLLAEFHWIWPQGLGWLWLFGVGFWACISHMCMTYALKFAPSATLAPLHYSEIVVAVILGWLIWRDLPDLLACVGILVIIGSGLYIIHRERISARSPADPAPQPAR